MPEKRAPTGKYWESTEYSLPEEKKRHLITPRTIGPAARPKPRRQPHGQREEILTGGKQEIRETRPRPVPGPPYPKPTSPPPRRGGVRPPQTVGTLGPGTPHNVGRTGNQYTKKADDMPKREEHALRQEAREKFPDDEERQDAYVYGTMRSHGWKPEHHSPWDGKTYRHWYWGVKKI